MTAVDRLLSQSVTIINRAQTGAADDFGDPTWTLTSTTAKGYLYQTTRTEDTNGQVLGFQEFRVALEAGAALDRTSQLLVDGTLYEVYGEPWQVFNPRTRRVDHIEATVRVTQ